MGSELKQIIINKFVCTLQYGRGYCAFVSVRMRCHMFGIALFIGVNSFVGALMNIVCELKITSVCKQIVQKFYANPTFP